MSDILFIKTSSLGDVIHHMPALTEARRTRPDARLSWMVEEAFAPLVRLHPGVDEVIPVAWRRWRKSLLRPATLGEIAASLRGIRARRYDEIIDSQGLLRSALMARIAQGRRHGYDSGSIREPLAAALYDVRHNVSRELHAIERNRILTGRALDYAPQGAPDYGLDRASLMPKASGKYAVLLHATARPEKQWPEENWVALGNALSRDGLDLVLPWGNDGERARARAHRGHAFRRPGQRASAARRDGAAHRRRIFRGRRRYRAAACRRSARRAAGRDLYRQQSRADRSGRVGADGRARRRGQPPSVEDVAHAVERIAP